MDESDQSRSCVTENTDLVLSLECSEAQARDSQYHWLQQLLLWIHSNNVDRQRNEPQNP